MVAVSVTLATVILLLALGQVYAAVAYSRRIARYVPIEVPDAKLPETLVVLNLRGADDSLLNCLEGLAKQDYPRYQVQIMIDHPSDPARAVVDRWLATQPPLDVRVEFLQRPSPASTVKCSSLRQVLRKLDPRFQAVVLIDADVQPYRRWLRDMVSPLALPQVGAVTGNRWYFPRQGSWGSWCRFIYNGLTLPPMDWFALPWAGSLAVRGDLARSNVLLSALETASSDESAVWKALRHRRLHLHLNPRAILWNPEPTDLSGCSQFVFRQLLWTRLYHPAWTGIFAHALGTCALLVAAFWLGLVGLWCTSPQLPAVLLGALGTYLGAVLVSLSCIHRTVRLHVLPQQGAAGISRITLTKLAAIAISAVLTLAVYTLAILRARLATRVTWRGIPYRVVPPDGIQVVEYRPFASRPASAKRTPHLPAGLPQQPQTRQASPGHA